MRSNLVRRAAVCAALCFALVATAGAQMNANPGEERFEKRFALAPGATLTVHNERGITEVEAYEGKEAVVQVYRHVDAGSEDRERWLRESRVDLSASANSLRVQVTRPSWLCVGWCPDVNARVELRIRVPRKTSVEVTGERSEVRIAGIEGDVRVENERGTLEVNDTRGALRAYMSRGTINARGIEVRGQLEVSAERAQVNIAAESLGSGASVSGDRANITISLPKGTGFELDYRGSRRTSFRSEFEVSVGRFDENVQGKVNGGGPLLRLRSDRGNIVLRQGSATL
jgi:hypothetical protein